ncbi:MAG: DNA primase catalytic subunit PriS [bacterium]|nr:DNA primase catalytic subunit PriS [bacterium]
MEKEKEVILRNFTDYYKKAEIEVPAVEQREFGVGGFRKKIESRHMGFKTDGALKNYLVQEAPLYISHSIAYYKFPESTPMERKEWMGGDLIFDLDVHAGMFLTAEEIEQVKEDAIKLEQILVEDFGVDEKELLRVFSGGRGFHIHVKSPRFRYLGGDERRQLSDYVSGVGLSFDKLFEKPDENKRIIGPKDSDWGYRGRFCKIVQKILEDDPSRIHRRLRGEEEKKKLVSGTKDGNWSRSTLDNKTLRERLQKIIEDEMKLESVDVDTGVTIDTKRLIRVPDTLHGSTGLMAKKLDRIEGFEPYRDALAFGEEPMKIRAKQDLPEQEFANSTMEKIGKEEEKEVPKSYGIYLILKDAATLSLS